MKVHNTRANENRTKQNGIKTTDEAKKATADARKLFQKYGEVFPTGVSVEPNPHADQSVAAYDFEKPNTILFNRTNIQKQLNIYRKTYPKIDEGLMVLGAFKHELRHREINGLLGRKGYTPTQQENIYFDNSFCIQEVDAEKVRYHAMVKNDPQFKRYFPTVTSISPYAKECASEFAKGNHIESPENVVRRIERAK
jgi:hypothetical protein